MPSRGRTLLVDGDILVYAAASAAERPINWGDGLWTLHCAEADVSGKIALKVTSLMETLEADACILALTSEDNFRYKVYPEYKHNRKDKRRPTLLPWARKWVEEHYTTFLRPGLEGDDVLGILATSRTLVEGERIIVSLDKDMKCIPGQLFNDGKPHLGIQEVSLLKADRWHMYQTLIGDTTDGYPGCPGVGPKSADKILDGAETVAEMWERVLVAYKKVKLGTDVALTMARVARICRASDYDFKEKAPILWQPPT